MKKYNTYLKSLIFLLIIFFIIIMFNYFHKNINIEGFTTFEWIDYLNRTNYNEKNSMDNNNPTGYFSNSNSLCNFPECGTFNNIKNYWNQSVIQKNKNKNTIKNKIDSYRVVSSPYNFLRFNISSPNCCQYSQEYTNGTGCLCLTQQQKNLLNSRGGNRRT